MRGGQREAAKPLASDVGGEGGTGSSGGHWVQPAVFGDAKPGTRIAEEEMFGPVATLLAFRGEAETVRIANTVVYRLVATV